jgi:hypothetical protein
MSEPRVQISFENGSKSFEPGAEVAGTVRILDSEQLGRSELSVLWYTEGKGDTDLGVVHYELLTEDRTTERVERDFRVRLPLLPLSYSGELLSIHWVARVRIYGFMGTDHVEDAGFRVVHRGAP